MNTVKFKIEKLEDPAKEGSEIAVGNTYDGMLDGNRVLYRDKVLTDWIFYPGDTCTIINEAAQLAPAATPTPAGTGFFCKLYALLEDKQTCKITITSSVDKLTLLINNKSKLITMTGTPMEIDDAIIDHLKVNGETTEEKFNVTVSDAPDSEEEDDGEEKPAKKKKVAPAAKKKASGAKKVAPKATAKPDARVEKDKVKLKEFTDALDRGKALMKEKDYEKAIEFFRQAKAVAPKGNDVAAKKIEEAKEAIEKAEVAEKKKEFDELMKLGLQQRKDRKYEDSLGTFKKAIKMFPEDPEAIKQLESAKKWIEALKGF